VANAADCTFRIIDSENVDTHGTSKRVYLAAVVNDKIVSCMCDSGSDVNFMPYQLVERNYTISMPMKSYAANSNVIEIMGHCRLTVHLAYQIKVDPDFLISKRVSCPMFVTGWLKENTSSWDFGSGNLTIQGYKFKLEEGEDLPNYCRKIMITEDVIVPPNSRKTVAGLVLISSVRVVNVPDWLTRHRMIQPWVQILHSLVDNRASNMSLMIVNDSEEDYLCKSGEAVTTMIPNTMGLEGWYGEDQASQVHWEAPSNYVGFVTIQKFLSKTAILKSAVNKTKPITSTITDESMNVNVSSVIGPIITIKPEFTASDITFDECNETKPFDIKDIVSNHIVQAVNNCMIVGVKKEYQEEETSGSIFGSDKQFLCVQSGP